MLYCFLATVQYAGVDLGVLINRDFISAYFNDTDFTNQFGLDSQALYLIRFRFKSNVNIFGYIILAIQYISVFLKENSISTKAVNYKKGTLSVAPFYKMSYVLSVPRMCLRICKVPDQNAPQIIYYTMPKMPLFG